MILATPADLKVRYDIRRLGDLVRDNGTRATSSDLDSDTILREILDDAESVFYSALLVGKRYKELDIEALTGRDANLVIRIVCDLAYGFLIMRRGFTEEEAAKLAPGFKLALAFLENLRHGDKVFNIEGAKEAGTVARVVLSRRINLVSSASRLFGNLDIQ